MATASKSAETSRRLPGRAQLWLGIILALSSPFLYIVQLQLKQLAVPWYAAGLGTAGVLLLVLSLINGRTVTRILALLICGALIGFEWFFLISLSRLPAYAGPVTKGQTFPPFSAVQADGAPFTPETLKGDQNTALVFFRGRW